MYTRIYQTIDDDGVQLYLGNNYILALQIAAEHVKYYADLDSETTYQGDVSECGTIVSNNSTMIQSTVFCYER